MASILRTWCSSAKRENFDHIPQIQRVSLYHFLAALHTRSFRISLYHSLISPNITKYLTRASRSNTGTVPGCDRRFAQASNRNSHVLTHQKQSSSNKVTNNTSKKNAKSGKKGAKNDDEVAMCPVAV